MFVSLAFLPKALRNFIQVLMAMGALIVATLAASTWLDQKARAAAESTVDRIERKVDRVSCLMEVHVSQPNPTANDYVRCSLKP